MKVYRTLWNGEEIFFTLDNNEIVLLEKDLSLTETPDFNQACFLQAWELGLINNYEEVCDESV